MDRKTIQVFGSVSTRVNVDPLSVMEAEYRSHVPNNGWLESINGRFLVMDDDRGIDYEVKVLTENEFNYLKSLNETTKLAKLARS